MNFLIVFFFTINFVWANCAPVNLVTEENSPFQKIPVFDQDGLNICYAYTASQLVDYHLIKKGNKERSVHPVWSAMKFAESKGRGDISMGIAYDTIKALRKYGNCPVETIESAFAEWSQKANANEVEIMALIEKLVKDLPETSDENIDQTISEAIKQVAPYCGGNPTFDQLLPELRALSIMSSRELFSKLALPNCQKEAQAVSISAPRFVLPKTDADVAPHFEKILNDYKSPIAISFCSRVLSEPSYVGLTRLDKNPYVDVQSNCSPHDALIVGKKKIDGQCHYLLRNTWGSGFHPSNKDRKCLCKNRKTGEYIDDCQESLHNNGDNIVEGCWVNEELFSKNTFGITHLK